MRYRQQPQPQPPPQQQQQQGVTAEAVAKHNGSYDDKERTVSTPSLSLGRGNEYNRRMIPAWWWWMVVSFLLAIVYSISIMNNSFISRSNSTTRSSKNRMIQNNSHKSKNPNGNYDYRDTPVRQHEQDQQQRTRTPRGQQIVDRSYYHSSGYYEFVTKVCPPPPPLLLVNTNTTTAVAGSSSSSGSSMVTTPSTVRHDFIIQCLEQARKKDRVADAETNRKQASTTTEAKTNRHHNHGESSWWFRTLLRDAAARSTALWGPWHILQFTNVGRGATTTDTDTTSTSSNPRLQLCVYEKGGTKNWKRLQCAHNNNYWRNNTSVASSAAAAGTATTTSSNMNDAMIQNGIDFNQCYQQQPLYDEQLIAKYKKKKKKQKTKTKNNYNNNNNYNYNYNNIRSDKVVFLRDPLERFLSGFLDKCIEQRHQKHCESTLLFSPSSSTSSSTKNTSSYHNLARNRILFQTYVDTFPVKWNMHFIPQALYCGGLYRTIQSYNFIGSMGRSLYRDLETLQTNYPGLSKAGINEIFAHNNNHNNNVGVETGATGKVFDYYTPHTVRRILEYYSIDYITLNLPIPQWAETILQEEEADDDDDERDMNE